MSQPCCNTKNPCLEPADPITNYSAEAPDVFLSFARSYGYGPFIPPIGTDWDNNTNTGFGEDPDPTTAQDKADKDKIDQDGDDWPITTPDPTNPDGPPINVTRPVFCNTAQHCTFICPNGDPFTVTITAGRFCAFNQATADLMALSEACKQATQKRLCLSELTTSAGCISQPFTSQIAANTPATSVTFTIVSGLLPDGITGSTAGTLFLLSGTPTSAGSSTFVIQASDGDGNIMVHEYTITIYEITPSSLTNASANTLYSQVLSLNPSTSAGWSILSGVLPNGLTINSETGEISGTPTETGTFNFTVGASLSFGTCSKDYTLTVTTACVDWAAVNWSEGIFDCGGVTLVFCVGCNGGSASCAYPNAASFNYDVATDANIFSTAGSGALADFIYNGAGCNCNLRVTVTAALGGTASIQILDQNTFAILLNVNVAALAVGVHDLPFSMPDTMGSDHAINIALGAQLSNPNLHMAASFELTNV